MDEVDPVLCEKTPLLRGMQALSRAGVRLLAALGHKCNAVSLMIGLEQAAALPLRARLRFDSQRWASLTLSPRAFLARLHVKM